MGYVWMGGKNKDQLLSWQMKTDSRGRGIEEKEESIISVNVQRIKMKYGVCLQLLRTKMWCIYNVPIPSICNQLIPVINNLSIVIENQYQSITTQILAIDGSSVIHIISIGIDYRIYRLDTLG